LILGIIFLFFKGATNFIMALTGLKKTGKNAPKKPEDFKKAKRTDDSVLYEKGETRVFKGNAGNKQKENNL